MSLRSPRPPASASALALTLLMATTLTPATALAQPTRTFLPGIRALGMSADGSAVTGIFGSDLTVRWTRSGGQAVFGSNFSEGTSISADGNVVAGRGFNSDGTYAFRWTSAGGLTTIGTLPGASGAEAYGINGDGSVLVGASYTPDFIDTAFRWTAAGGMQSLGTLPGDTRSQARGTSADGNTVVGNGSAIPFRWTQSSGMVGLPAVPGDIGAYSAYNSPVSADGQFVAGTGDSSPIRWDAAGTPMALGLPAGFILAEANAISGDGFTVLGTAYDGTLASAYYWTAATGPVALSSYLTSLGVNLTGITLTDAQNCSFDGSTIVAFGTVNGQEGSIVFTGVPTPGAASMLAIGGLFAARRRRAARGC